jgi:hypothetical protein
VDRRRFDHLYEELSVALGQLVPRYALWLHMAEVGLDPERLSRVDATRFCRDHLAGLLASQRLILPERQARRLGRRMARFDPCHPTPYEHMARLGERPGPR